MYKNENEKKQIEEFIKNLNSKVKKKLDFVLKYIADENNQLKEPDIKHFSIEKYKMFYELRLKAANTMVRIIYYSIDDKIILLHAFIKKDKRDTEQALEYTLKLVERLDKEAQSPMDFLSEVKID